jgi:aerobic carbon-monoxide dehydrogenase medium subunit
MKPPPFTYRRATSLDEALAALAEAGDEGKVLAGGQSLIPLLNMRLAAPGVLVDINRVDGLDVIEVTDAHVRVGATVRHAALERHAGARDADPLLSAALGHVAHPVIRNRGTTVGSIAHADPAGEMPAVLAVLGGHAEVASAGGRRTIAASELFAGPLESSLQPGELVTHVTFPHPPPGSGTAFAELARRHGDYAMAGVAAVVTLDDDRHVSAATVGYLGLAGVPVVVDLTEQLAGRPHDALDPGDAAREAVGHTDPTDDIHATAAYRRHLAGVLTERALAAAAANATDTGKVPA